MKNRKLACLLALLVPFLGGCAAAAIGGSTYAVKASKRSDLMPDAAAGDAESQYRLGLSWCCMGPGFDTQTATKWLCKAAAQQHPLAHFELGRIYSGDISRTPAPGQKILKLATAGKSPIHAAYWFTQAASLGVETAASERDRALEQLNAAEKEQLDLWTSGQMAVPCEYGEVFAD